METTVTSAIDQAIEQYRSDHGGNKPLYIIMSADEADELAEEIRQRKGQKDDAIVTSYRDIKIVRNNMLERGKYQLMNELPETGS